MYTIVMVSLTPGGPQGIYIGGGPREIGDIGWFIYAYYVVTDIM